MRTTGRCTVCVCWLAHGSLAAATAAGLALIAVPLTQCSALLGPSLARRKLQNLDEAIAQQVALAATAGIAQLYAQYPTAL